MKSAPRANNKNAARWCPARRFKEHEMLDILTEPTETGNNLTNSNPHWAIALGGLIDGDFGIRKRDSQIFRDFGNRERAAGLCPASD